MAHAAEPFSHPALMYRGHDEYLAGTVPFITEGLAAGDPVAVAVPAPRLAALRDELGAAATSVRLIDLTDAGRNPGRIIPGVLRAFADAHPGRHVRIVGEPIWPRRSAQEYPACVQHEALINESFTGRSAMILCPYDADLLEPSVLADAARTHPVLVDGGGTLVSEHFAPLAAVEDHNVPLSLPEGAEVLAVHTPDLSGLRRVAAAFARGRGLCVERVEDLVLALTELATNSIEHAASTATVLLGGNDEQVVCQVRDTGHLTDPLVGRRPAPPHQLGGRGLLMVNVVADLVRIHTTPAGTTVEIRFDVR